MNRHRPQSIGSALKTSTVRWGASLIRMSLDRTALRRYTQWLPFLALVAVCVAWWSPLGVIAGLAVCLALGGALQRIDLVGNAVGGSRLRSQSMKPFAERPPAHDVLLDWGELGMGGPAYSTQMLRDGAIVEGVSTGGSRDASGEWQDLPGGALRLASGYVDRCEAVIVYDERQKTVQVLAADPGQFRQQLGERLQTDGEAGAASWLRSQSGGVTQLHSCRGLWLEHGHPALAAGLPQELRHVLPDARVLRAVPLLPDDLRVTAHPALFACICPYALYLDETSSGRHACDLETVIASPSGRCLVVAGSVLDENLRPIEGVWLVCWQGRWQAFARHAMGGFGKARSMAWINVIDADDDGTLQCEAYEERWEFDAVHRYPTRHTALELPVEWRETGLALRARDGRFRLRLPSR